MRSSKGFTLVEMVMGLLLVGLIIMVAMAFMILQSRYGRVAAGQRSAREVVALALNMIAKDVRQAGYGLGDEITDPVAIHSLYLAMLPDPTDSHCYKQTWDDGSTHWCYDRLFIQYGMYIQDVFELQPEPGGGKRYFKPGPGASIWPFAGSGVDISTEGPVKYSLINSQVGGLIGYKYNAASESLKRRMLLLDWAEPTYSIKDASTGSSATTEADTYYAPAVVYTYHGHPDYEIRRNGVSLTAGRQDMRITGFCVQATFCDSLTVPCTSATAVQVPQDRTDRRFETYPIRNLRTIVITVRYKIRQAIPRSSGPDADSERVWTVAPEFKRTVVVAPRAIAMQASLTQDIQP